ncbi:MAG: LysR family transcriptional regulator [Verrucomicrobiota bacterium]|jgi:DNA-binding transcriptional LysR family regulator
MTNIHHLELFYYVARHGGIMEAVRNIPYGIQQPAVSGQILQLESDLGLKLFQRRPFQLTPAGEELFEFVRPFFGNVEAVGERLRGGATLTLRMAAPAVVLRDHLPAVLQDVQARFPRLRIVLRDAHQPLVEAWLERHEIDFAVTILEGRPVSGLLCEPLVQLQPVFLVRDDSPFHKSTHVLDALAGGSSGDDRNPSGPAPSLISLPSNEALPRQLRELLAARDLEWPAAIEVNSLDLIEIYAAAGFGVGLGFALPGARLHRALRALPVAELKPLQVGALWRGKPTPLVEALLASLRSRAQALVR